MLDSIKKGIPKIVLFDGTPSSVDYALGLKRRSELFTMVGCVYGSKRDTLMTLVKRINEFMTENFLSKLPLQIKLLPIKGKYVYQPSERLSVYLNEIASYLDDNPKLANAVDHNGCLYPVNICISVALLSLSDYKNDESKLQRDLKIVFGDSFNYSLDITSDCVRVNLPNNLGRSIDLIIYFKDSKLNEYAGLNILCRKSIESIAKERELGYEIPNR